MPLLPLCLPGMQLHRQKGRTLFPSPSLFIASHPSQSFLAASRERKALFKIVMIQNKVTDLLLLNFVGTLVWTQESSYQEIWIEVKHACPSWLSVPVRKSDLQKKERTYNKALLNISQLPKTLFSECFLRQGSDMLIRFKLHQFSYHFH